MSHMSQKMLLTVAAGLGAVAGIVFLLGNYGIVDPPPLARAVPRWLALAVLLLWCVRRRSLTAWILFSMLVGAEVGHAAPDFAVNLKVMSQIFIKLVKVIIAPL